MRSLKTRLKEYRDNLLLLADQVIMITEAYPRLAEEDKANLEMVAEHYTLLCADLTKLVKGEELERYILTVSEAEFAEEDDPS